MFFTAVLAVAAASASIALAQDVSFNGATPTQCQSSTFSYNAPEGSYYAAVVPADNACSGDPLAEFHDVTGGTVDYFVNIAAGTQIQVYVADSNGNEFWSSPMTVGDGDSSCLGGAAAASSTTVTSTSSRSSTSSTPSVYVAPANFASSTRATTTSAASDSSVDDTPANAATSGASSVAVSFTLLGGALLAAAALF